MKMYLNPIYICCSVDTGNKNCNNSKSSQEEKDKPTTNNSSIPATQVILSGTYSNSSLFTSSSIDYLTPQKPTYYQHIIEDHHQLQNESMFNKTQSKISNNLKQLNLSLLRQRSNSSISSMSSLDINSNSNSNSLRSFRNKTYKEIELIHNGKYNKTYKCLNKLDNNHYVIKHDHDKQHNEECMELIREGHILSALQRSKYKDKRYENIVKYYEMWREFNCCYIVIEYCHHNLINFKNIIEFNEKLLIRIILHISRGLSFLHQNRYIHFNINPSNILIKDEIFKITDFKLSQKFSSNNDKENYEKIPKLCQYTDDETRYLSQEMVKQGNHLKPQLLNKIDIFSLGLIIFEIIREKELHSFRSNKYWNEIRNDSFL